MVQSEQLKVGPAVGHALPSVANRPGNYFPLVQWLELSLEIVGAGVPRTGFLVGSLDLIFSRRTRWSLRDNAVCSAVSG